MIRREKKKKVPIGFGEKLYNLIIKSGKSFNKIDEETRINHSNLRAYCDETMLPSAYNLYVICKYFKVSADYLLGLKEKEK